MLRAWPIDSSTSAPLPFICFAGVPRQPRREMTLHVRPFVSEDAVHHLVAHGSVAARLMVANHAILPRAECLDRALGRAVEVVGAETHHLAAKRLERVGQEQQLAGAVNVTAL